MLTAGAAATLFLLVEKHPFTAFAAAILAAFFALVIVMLVPPVGVTLFVNDTPSITISQRSRASFPFATYAVVTPDGHTLGFLRKSLFNRWTISDTNDRPLAVAAEESFPRAVVRKFLGKFSRRYETNVHIGDAGDILRRTDKDVLQINGSLVDDRVLIALATLVLGSEP